MPRSASLAPTRGTSFLKEARMSSNEELDYAGGGLKQETNWWGAFVIGLAGAILVTGLRPRMGAVPRAPALRALSFREKWPRAAKHINGRTAWAYWLGWFPVAPLNMILASFYLADRFGLNTTAGVPPRPTLIHRAAPPTL